MGMKSLHLINIILKPINALKFSIVNSSAVINSNDPESSSKNTMSLISSSVQDKKKHM